MNLEALALARAQEQIESGAWRRKDPDERREKVPPRVCVICGTTLAKLEGSPRMCLGCRDAGWAASPCRGCGGKLRRNDQMVPAKERRGFCHACRVEMPQVQKGAESLVIARAVRAANLAARKAS